MKKNNNKKIDLLEPPIEALYPLWLSVSEAAKVAGLQTKTIRRGLDSGMLKFQVIRNRYRIDFSTLVTWLLKNIKLRNKFIHNGLGQYVDKWKTK